MRCEGTYLRTSSNFLHWPSFKPCQLLFFASVWSARFYLTLERKSLHLRKPICCCFALTQLPRKFIRNMTPTRRCFSVGSLCNCLANTFPLFLDCFFFSQNLFPWFYGFKRHFKLPAKGNTVHIWVFWYVKLQGSYAIIRLEGTLLYYFLY